MTNKSSENSLQDVLLDSEEKHAEEMNRTEEAYSPDTKNAPTVVAVTNEDNKEGCCSSGSCWLCCQPDTWVCCAYLCCVGSQRETRHINFTEGTYDYHKETDINNSLCCLSITCIQECFKSGCVKNMGECVSNNACCLFKCCENSASGAGETVVNVISTVGSAGDSVLHAAGDAAKGIAHFAGDIGPDVLKVSGDVFNGLSSVAEGVISGLG